jgi:hypothetical protein
MLTGLVCMLSLVTRLFSGMTRGLVALSALALMCAVPCGALEGLLKDWMLPFRLWRAATAGFGLVCLDVCSLKRRSSARAATPESG